MLIQKPKETTEWLNRFLIHPLSNKLVRYLINTQVTPNHLSILGLVYAIMGAFTLYYSVDSTFCFAFSMFFFFLRMICDASDGQLARAKKQSSEMGTIIDGICDYLSFFFIYSAIACLYYPTYGAIIFLLILITGCSNALQASSYQLFLDLYNFIKYQQAGAKIKFILESKPQKLSFFLLIYNKLQLCFLTKQEVTQLMSINQEQKTYNKITGLLPYWHLLALNFRYFLLVILIKHILVYFFIEFIVLNLVLFRLLNRTKALIQASPI